MIEQIVETEVPERDIVATGVSTEEFMQKYAAHRYEWVQGDVIKMSPISFRHDELTAYLRILARCYFALNPIGVVKQGPFVMRMDEIGAWREPDLQIILKTNPGKLTETAMIGPADICIEVVSPGSIRIDYGDKFEEYEKAGVKEYWLLDHIRQTPYFYRLNEEGLYRPQPLDDGEHYVTPLLPTFRLHVPTLWQQELPDPFAIGEYIKALFEQG